MNASTLLADHHCLAFGRRSLHQLRQALERDTGMQSATYLQEAGFAGGEELFNAYAAWLTGRYGVASPSALDIRHLGETLSVFFKECGWGSLTVTPVAQPVIALDSVDWSEADPGSGAQYPSCHLTSGLLADFLGRVSNTVIGVMEVECLSRGDARCRFLAGAPDALQALYQRMAQGHTYQQALGIEG